MNIKKIMVLTICTIIVPIVWYFLQNNPISTPLHLAIFLSENTNLINVLVKIPGVNINAKAHDHGLTPLHLACKMGSKNIVAILLKTPGIGINATTYKEQTALHLAGNPDVAKLLITASEININARDLSQKTPLHYACASGKKEIAKLLINTPNIEINARDIFQRTPLHDACLSLNAEDLVKLLVDQPNIEINAKDTNRLTPLHYTCLKGSSDVKEVVKLLLAKGADINAVAHPIRGSDQTFSPSKAFGSDMTVLDIARLPGQQVADLPDFLISHGAKSASELTTVL